jgi:hypothetical protein
MLIILYKVEIMSLNSQKFERHHFVDDGFINYKVDVVYNA